jgi:hypothetical protein
MTRHVARARFTLESEARKHHIANLVIVLSLATLLYGFVMFYFDGMAVGGM